MPPRRKLALALRQNGETDNPDSSVYYSADSSAGRLENNLRRERADTALFEQFAVQAAQQARNRASKIVNRLRNAVTDQTKSKPKPTKPTGSKIIPIPIPIPGYKAYDGTFVPESKISSLGNWAEGTGKTAVVKEASGYTQIPVYPERIVQNNYKHTGTFTMSKQAKSALSTSMVRIKNAPVAVSKRINTQNKPVFGRSSRGVVMTHKELLGNLITSGTALAYNTKVYVINAGNSGTFPWLNTLASNFDKYRFTSLKFHLISNQPTTTGGRMGIGFDFDSTDVAPADRSEFFSLTRHAECSPWDSVTLLIPVDGKDRFVNSHTTTDSKLIDFGQVILMSSDVANAGTSLVSTNIADILVEYTVELLEPQQAIYNTMIVSAVNQPSFDLFTVKGPTIAKLVYGNSTTVLQAYVPPGWYSITSRIYDSGAGGPNLTHSAHGGTGTTQNLGSATINMTMSTFNATTTDAYFIFTFATVTIANLEQVSITITRSTAAAFSGFTYGNALTIV